ncbi:MAG: uracil-DNA glycosylase family protein [Zunongwangia sp.]|uniref:uracil-DNA glycosylase family protein n=1 Tax=Zunongwangia sp. TaxID=1965325 RepID=UPI003242E9D4
MNEIFRLYNELLDSAKPNFGQTHGLQILHKGRKINEDSILYVGRENRGHGNRIANFNKPINNFITNDFKWLDDSYKYSKSPFWRVVGKSLSKITNKPYNVEIFERIYWTNIFKISPHERRPNNNKTRLFQTDLCKRILLEEIMHLRPKAVVFLTDDWVRSYLDDWKQKKVISKINSDFELGYYNLHFQFNFEENKIPAIVLPHPQNTSSGASEQNLIDHIAKRIKI